ncbi:hypothetical protein BST61_g5405 [Cercospora zeina]
MNALNPNGGDPSPPEVLVGSIVPMLSMQCIAGSTHAKELRPQLAVDVDQGISRRGLCHSSSSFHVLRHPPRPSKIVCFPIFIGTSYSSPCISTHNQTQNNVN